MFDRYFVSPRIAADVSVHHTEKRAPTDESVRILREMEAAARSSVVESMRLTNNDVECIVHRHESAFDLQTLFSIHYSVNGRKREARLTVKNPSTIQEQQEAVWKALADDLAAMLLTHTTERR